MFKFKKQYPVFGRISDEKWSWLCDNLGAPGKVWTVSRGAVWFLNEQHKTLYILKWT